MSALKRKVVRAAGAGLTLAVCLGLNFPASQAATAEKAADTGVGVAAMRRLTPEQYANIIEEVFGPSIELGGRFEPELRVDHLNELGSGQLSMSSLGMAQFDSMARSIAAQVVSEKSRDIMIPCKPAAANGPDDACATKFLAHAGSLLFRRPLTQPELQSYVQAAHAASVTAKDFYTGLSLTLGAVLSSPQFLFRQATVEPDPDNRGQFRLDAYSKATRLSFFLWNTMPDAALLTAAEKGELNSKKGVEKQVARMLASHRLEDGVRAFFADMLQLDGLSVLAKDTTLYPKFDAMVARDAREQTLRTIVDLLVEHRGDYRDLFTARKTYLTQALASVYRIPLVNEAPNGSQDFWQAYELPEGDPRAGILTELSFVALNSHPGRSSPTLRGKALREVILCQKVPAPPAAVNFSIVQDTSNPVYRTARARLTAHAVNPVCAGCHKLIDPMGLALENFDGSGAFRTEENGVALDTSGTLDGVKFNNAAELGRVVRDNPATTSCVVDRLLSYGIGRAPVASERAWADGLKAAFIKDGHVIPDLMRRIATSPEFFRAEPRIAEVTKASLN
ncbi:MAG: DUF1592 domain-containing protein [Rhodospirillaceae bacterium]|nr:DUF1592 domain-containing protein [Rhodospirillaceae bacterium]